MHPDLLLAILAYATIPVYVFGLLILTYIIARFQLGWSLSGQIRQALKRKRELQKPKAPIGTYILVGLLFALFTLLTILTQRRQPV